MPLAAMGISAGTSILGGILGSSAASKAAQQQAAAAQKAANYAQQTGQAALGAQTGATAQQVAGAQPYTTAGAGAVGQLNQMLQPGGALSATWNQQFQAPTPAQAEAQPGYQFTLGQGVNALQRGAAAGGNLLSGGAQKALMQYGQGLASQNYQQVYNNMFQNYQQNYQQFLNNQAGVYGRLMGVAGMGQTSTAQLNQLLQAGAENQARINANMSGQYGQDVTNVGAAQAQGTIGAANAWTGALSGVGNAAMGGAFLNALGNQGGGGGVAPLSSFTNPGSSGAISSMFGGPSSVPLQSSDISGSIPPVGG